MKMTMKIFKELVAHSLYISTIVLSLFVLAYYFELHSLIDSLSILFISMTGLFSVSLLSGIYIIFKEGIENNKIMLSLGAIVLFFLLSVSIDYLSPESHHLQTISLYEEL